MGDTEPKVKPLVAFAAVKGDEIELWAIAPNEREVKFAVDDGRPGGWLYAQEDGYRIIRVRIEPVEE